MKNNAVSVEDGAPSDMVPAILIGVAGFLAVAYFTVFSVPENSIVAVVFPPSITLEEAYVKITNADALVIREELDGMVMVVMPQHPKFIEQIQSYGAWTVVNPLGFGGCGSGGLVTKKLPSGQLVIK